MHQVRVRNVVIGNGTPKVCVPLAGSDQDQLLRTACNSLSLGADIYELRADQLGSMKGVASTLHTVKKVRDIIGDVPLIFTLRSKSEGGNSSLSDEMYKCINMAAIESNLIDMIDIELEKGKKIIKSLSFAAKENDVLTVLSKHFFKETPDEENIIATYLSMQQFDVSMTKVAVMAFDEGDLLKLLNASYAMKSQYADRPYIAISMGQKGMLSRIGGGLFGSSITFAKGMEASAPGQIEASDVQRAIKLLHN